MRLVFAECQSNLRLMQGPGSHRALLKSSDYHAVDPMRITFYHTRTGSTAMVVQHARLFSATGFYTACSRLRALHMPNTLCRDHALQSEACSMSNAAQLCCPLWSIQGLGIDSGRQVHVSSCRIFRAQLPVVLAERYITVLFHQTCHLWSELRPPTQL